MAIRGAIYNTTIGQQFAGNNNKQSTLIDTNTGSTISQSVSQPTPEQVAKATPEYRKRQEALHDEQIRNS